MTRNRALRLMRAYVSAGSARKKVYQEQLAFVAGLHIDWLTEVASASDIEITAREDELLSMVNAELVVPLSKSELFPA